MSPKLIIACAALATIAGAALLSSTGDAGAARGGFAMSRAGGARTFHAAPRGGMHAIHRGPRIGVARHHLRPIRHMHRPHLVRHHHHGWCWRHPWRCRPGYVGWRPYLYMAPAVVATAYATTPAVSRCTCLTKDYLPDGSVLFKDVCTREEALMPNPNTQTSQAPSSTP